MRDKIRRWKEGKRQQTTSSQTSSQPSSQPSSHSNTNTSGQQHDRYNHNSSQPTQSFYQRTLNKSNIVFNETEQQLLDRGLQYNLHSQNLKQNIERLIVDTEIAIENMNYDNKDILKNHCAFKIKSLYNKATTGNGQEQAAMKNIKKKIEEQQCVVTRADKGRTTIIMEKTDYVRRVEKFLADNNFTITNRFNLVTFNRKVKNELKRIGFDLQNTAFNVKKLNVNNPLPPKLYGLMKIHKTPIWDDVPIRPVVSSIQSPTYFIAKFLNLQLKTILSLEFKHTVKNSSDLCQKISSVVVPNNAVLISFDVCNLFTNVPVKEVLDIVEDLFKQNNINKNESESYLSLLKLALSQNMCQFNNINVFPPEG